MEREDRKVGLQTFKTEKQKKTQIEMVWFMVFNATFNNISVIPWRSVLYSMSINTIHRLEPKTKGDNKRYKIGRSLTGTLSEVYAGKDASSEKSQIEHFEMF
jgi:3-hydroxy-3-methylglutaryl CoA synthase